MSRHLPALHRRLISRPRLIHKLNAHSESCCTVIMAPAGFGKTTLAAQWLHQMNNATPIWMLLRERDADPWQFADHILEAATGIHEIRADVEAVRALLRIQKISTLGAIDAIIRISTKLMKPLLLALDDVHLADSTESKAILQMLVNSTHDALRLILITRSLVGIRLPPQALTLSFDDLRFDHEEYLSYAQGVRLSDLSQQDQAFLEQRCEGWITALQLLALAPDIKSAAAAMQQSPDTSREYLAEYLDHIVLRTLDPRMRSLLMRCAILPFITSIKAAELTQIPAEECASLLEQAVAGNLFLHPYSDEHTTNAFRLHPLFREFLLRQLRREIGRDEFHNLQHKAANILAAAGNVDDALDLLLQIDDVDAAADLVAQFSRQTLLEFDLITMHSRISRLPEGQIDLYPGLVVDLALVEVCKGSSGRRRALDRARRCIENNRVMSSEPNPWRRVTFENELELIVLEAITCFMEGDLVRAHKNVRLALKVPTQPTGLTLGLLHMAQAYAPENPADLQKRILHASEAAAAFQSIGFTHAHVAAKAAQAIFYRRAGNGRQALKSFDQALYESDRQTRMRTETAIDICVDYAETLYWMNQIAEARIQLRRVLSSPHDYEKTRYAYLKAELYRCMPALRQPDDSSAFDAEADRTLWRMIVAENAPSTIGEFTYLRILRDAWRADFDACIETLKIIGIPYTHTEGMTNACFDAAARVHENALIATLAYCVLAGHVTSDVERRLREMADAARVQANMPLHMRAQTLLALSQFLQHDRDGAEASLADLMPIIEQSHMPHIMLSHPGIDVLLAHSTHPHAAILLAQYRSASGRIDAYGFTIREIELMRCIAVGQSPAEAAREVGITQTTARWHIKNACRKLNVHSYHAAARIYRQITEV